MVADGFATRRGRRAALVHRDEVHGHAARTARRAAAGHHVRRRHPRAGRLSRGARPDGTFVGTLNEDFAIESMVGDVFQLGNTSWRVLQVTTGTVRVADAEGAPPNIPFWLGEAPARSDELSRAVSDLRAEVARRLDAARPVTPPGPPDPMSPAPDPRLRPTRRGEPATRRGARAEPGPPDPIEYRTGPAPAAERHADALAWLQAEAGLTGGAAEQIVEYLAEGLQALGCMPTQDTLVLERFFDESGGMQLVLHAPFGSRVMRAWALALRKRFCRQFNFELQAAATEDALLLSLGPQHSFPLADVFRYLHPASVRDVLVQAMLDAPVFETRWRWNATISLAVPRNRHGRRCRRTCSACRPTTCSRRSSPTRRPASRTSPATASCRTIRSSARPCATASRRRWTSRSSWRCSIASTAARSECLSRDTPEPSVLAHEILNARPYAFLDDAPLEERRTHAVQTRRAGERRDDFGALDESAIARVRDEQRPDPRDADELHDALQVSGILTRDEVAPFDALLQPLIASGRVTRVRLDRGDLLVAAERLPEVQALHPGARLDPPIAAPATRAARSWTAAEALVSLVRARLTMAGPTTAAALAATLHVAEGDLDTALLALEADGAALRGRFTPGASGIEWCDRGLLARIHRYTLTRLRAEIAPVTAADFMRFLFDWQHVSRTARVSGLDGLRAVLEQCDGLELPARAWERDVLPARMDRYEPALLDTLCLTGEIAWARLSSGPTQIVGATPIALFLREHADIWRTAPVPPGATPNPEPRTPNAEPRTKNPEPGTADEEPGTPNIERTRNPEPGTPNRPTPPLDTHATRVLVRLQQNGASFVHDLASTCALGMDELRTALAALVAAGQVSSDGFAGLRALVAPAAAGGGTAGRHRVETAGRWFALPPRPEEDVTGDRVDRASPPAPPRRAPVPGTRACRGRCRARPSRCRPAPAPAPRCAGPCPRRVPAPGSVGS
jgi:ATP-dependent helicase Lhr and Lhr-like helicase